MRGFLVAKLCNDWLLRKKSSQRNPDQTIKVTLCKDVQQCAPHGLLNHWGADRNKVWQQVQKPLANQQLFVLIYKPTSFINDDNDDDNNTI